MTIDYNSLMNWEIPDAFQEYSQKDCILYALGLGFGGDPTDSKQLRYVYEKDLVPFPSMAVVLAMGGSWARAEGTGIDFTQLLHAEAGFEIHRPLPVKGSVVSKTRVTDVIDKGPGRGAIVISQRQLFLNGEPSPMATFRSSSFCRADGGFGGPVTVSPKPHPIPDRAPDLRIRIKTLPQSALIYRLSGDYNELHCDPEIAQNAGFERPILHGLCSFGTAVRSVVEGFDLDPVTVKGAGVRFTSPVYPAETLETAIWRDSDIISFRTRVTERDVLVLNHGWPKA